MKFKAGDIITYKSDGKQVLGRYLGPITGTFTNTGIQHFEGLILIENSLGKMQMKNPDILNKHARLATPAEKVLYGERGLRED